MELGASKTRLMQLGAVLTVLVGVLYFQLPRGQDISSNPSRTVQPAAATSQAIVPNRTHTPSRVTPRGARFQPTMSRPQSEAPPDPLTANPTLRSDLLEKVRGIEMPSVQRDIFNFWVAPRPVAPPPTPDEARLAQAHLQEQMKKKQQPKPAPTPIAKQPSKPNWTYYGLVINPETDSKRVFLLNDEEILIGEQDSVIALHYRIMNIDAQSILIKDMRSNQQFTYQLEVPQ